MEGIVKVGIIGCGWITEYAHIPALVKERMCRVVSLFDSDYEKAEKLGKKWEIPNTYNDLYEFLDSGIEAVIIATPNAFHVKYTVASLKRGIHVLCEKPVAFHMEEIEQIRQVLHAEDVVYVPGFVNRWREDIQKLYQIISEERVGKIVKMEAGWLRKAGVPRPGTWFTNRALAGGGVLTDLGSHVADICLFCLGNREPVSYKLVSAVCDNEEIKKTGGADWFLKKDAGLFDMNVEDSIIANVLFQDDVELEIRLSWLAPVEADCTYFKICGTQGEILLRTLFGFSTQRLWEKDILECTQNGVKTEMIFNEDRSSAQHAFEEMISYFIKAVANHKAGFTNITDAGRTVSLIENLYMKENRGALRDKKYIVPDWLVV